MCEDSVRIKITIVGESGVGKSSLLTVFCGGQFQKEAVSTVGEDQLSAKRQINGRAVKIQLVDTAGQERFASLTKNTYHGAAGIIVAYDITSRTSFEKVGKWITEARNVNPHAIFLLVACKSDLLENRVVQLAEGDTTARSFGINFLETSAKENENVERAFQYLLSKAMETSHLNVRNSEDSLSSNSASNRRPRASFTLDTPKQERKEQESVCCLIS